ncbi:hypothetical protein FHS24_001252 [Psychrobacter luti]|uniref:Uncharacterized protein n=1 Tax=Psychrobacter luti TaxID=198481 RepID=A0A839TBE5_9GAMM|nr:hypothetical protein [Psychrobacter luti]
MLLSFDKIVVTQSIKAMLSNVTIFCNDKHSYTDNLSDTNKYSLVLINVSVVLTIYGAL